jgi:hypothetical protein
MKYFARILFLLTLLLPSHGIFAQYKLHGDANTAKSAPGKVLLIAKGQLRSDAGFEYQEALFRNHWTLNDTFAVKTKSELEAINKDRNNDYLYLDIDAWESSQLLIAVVDAPPATYKFFEIGLALSGTKKSIAVVNARGSDLNPIDLLFAMGALQHMARFLGSGEPANRFEKTINARAAELKNKTLLLPKSITWIGMNDIVPAYPYPYETMSDEEVLSRIRATDERYAYVYASCKAGSEGTNYGLFVMDCADNSILLYAKPALTLPGQMAIDRARKLRKQKLVTDTEGHEWRVTQQPIITEKVLKSLRMIIDG